MTNGFCSRAAWRVSINRGAAWTAPTDLLFWDAKMCQPVDRDYKEVITGQLRLVLNIWKPAYIRQPPLRGNLAAARTRLNARPPAGYTPAKTWGVPGAAGRVIAAWLLHLVLLAGTVKSRGGFCES